MVGGGGRGPGEQERLTVTFEETETSTAQRPAELEARLEARLEALAAGCRPTRSRSMLFEIPDTGYIERQRTYWVGNIKNNVANRRYLRSTLRQTGDIEALTVRKKDASRSTSWALVTFARAPDLTSPRQLADGCTIALLDETRICSADAVCTRLFHDYKSTLDLTCDDERNYMEFSSFARMMRNTFEADPESIQAMWSLPEFVDRTTCLERKEVVTLEKFRDTLQDLGLLADLGFNIQGEEPAASAEEQAEADQTGVFMQQERGREGREAPIDPQNCCLKSKTGEAPIDPQNWRCLKSKTVFAVFSIWDAWLVLLLCYVTATVPVRIGFGIETILWSGWFCMDILTDLSFVLDILKNFLSHHHLVDEDRCIKNFAEVRRFYLGTLGIPRWLDCRKRKNRGRGWKPGPFYIDLFSSLPITYLQMALNKQGNNTTKLLRLLRILRLMKLLQLAKVGNLLDRNAESLRDVDEFAIVKAACSTAVFAHLIGCGWHYLALDRQGGFKQPSWMTDYDDSLISNSSSFADRYIASLYFATTTLSTVGYGDILPTNTDERIYVALCQVIGVFTFGYTMGTLSGYIMEPNLDPRQKRYTELMPAIDAYLRMKRVPKDETDDSDNLSRESIRKKLGHVLLHDPDFGVVDEERCLEAMRAIDTNIEREVVRTIYKDHPVPRLFKIYKPTSDVMVDLAHYLEPAHNRAGERDFEPGETIVEQGAVARGIYVIERGECEVWLDGTKEDTLLRQGDCFGEISAMGRGDGTDGRQHTRRVSTYSGASVGETKVRCNFLSIERMEKLFARYPEMERTLRMQVSLRRAKEARTRREKQLKLAGFPTTVAMAAAEFRDICAAEDLSMPEISADLKRGHSGTTLTFDAISRWLQNFSELLPISEDLQCQQRLDKIRLVFDTVDGDGVVNEREFWRGCQTFLNDPHKIAGDIEAREPSVGEKVQELTEQMQRLTTMVQSIAENCTNTQQR